MLISQLANRVYLLHDMGKDKKQRLRRKLIFDYIADDQLNEVKRIMNILNFLAEQGHDVKKRTVNLDLDFLQEEGLIHAHEKGRATYYSAPNKFEEIDSAWSELDADDFFSLEMASNSLEQLAFFDLSKDLKRIITQLKKKRNEVEKRTLVQFDKQNLIMDVNLFRKVFECIKLKYAVLIGYKSFKAEAKESEIIFHPYFLKEFNNRWFVIGYNEQFEQLNNLAMDRVTKVKPLISLAYNEKNNISPEVFSKNLFGVTREGRPVTIEVELTSQRAPYFESKPLMKIISSENIKEGKRFKFKAIINNELKAALLSYGSDLKVIGPANLKKDIFMILSTACKKY